MTRLLIILAVLMCAGCGSPDPKYCVIAERSFWSSDFTGKHAVMYGGRTVGLFDSYAEADSVCQVLKGRDYDGNK